MPIDLFNHLYQQLGCMRSIFIILNIPFWRKHATKEAKYEAEIVSNTPNFYTFEGTSKKALLFFPGFLVDSSAYSIVLKEIRDLTNITIICIKPKYGVATMFTSDDFDSIYSEYSSIAEWYIGGHSAGVLAAAAMIHGKYGFLFKKMINWAGTVSHQYSLSNLSSCNIMTIFGSEDKICNFNGTNMTGERVKDILITRYPLCKHVTYVIDGGNHSGFGMYNGKKSKFDGERKISLNNQQGIIADITSQFLLN